MEPEEMIDTIIRYKVNGIAGDTGQIIQLMRYISTLSEDTKKRLPINKAIYTSEPMTPAQYSFMNSVFPKIAVSSIIGSAEAGPWAVSPAKLTEATKDQHYADFIYDKRLMHLEVFPFCIEDPQHPVGNVQPLPDAEKGLLVQTSLQRLRHPLIRYICGDICSLHPLLESIKDKIPPKDAPYYKVARIYGRDRRISFDWYGEYFEFPAVEAAMRTDLWGILQYQIIRRHKVDDEDCLDIVLEVRILRHDEPGTISREELTREMRKFFWVFENNEELFCLEYLSDYSGFVRSATGRKVINFIDRTHG